MRRCKRYRELFRFLRYFYQLNFWVQLDHGFEVTGSNPTGSIFKNLKTQFLVSHNVRNLLFKANQTLYFRIFLRSWVGFEPGSSDFVKISCQLRKIPKTELISQQVSQNAKRAYWRKRRKRALDARDWSIGIEITNLLITLLLLDRFWSNQVV